jgi:hypothetical protein
MNRLGDHAAKLARDGDWDALRQYLERGWPLTPAICEFLVDVFLGRVTRPRHKPKQTAATMVRDLEIGGFVEDLRRQGVRNPILRAERFFGMSRRKLQTAVNKFEKLKRDDPEMVELTVQAKGWKSRGAI